MKDKKLYGAAKKILGYGGVDKTKGLVRTSRYSLENYMAAVVGTLSVSKGSRKLIEIELGVGGAKERQQLRSGLKFAKSPYFIYELEGKIKAIILTDVETEALRYVLQKIQTVKNVEIVDYISHYKAVRKELNKVRIAVSVFLGRILHNKVNVRMEGRKVLGLPLLYSSSELMNYMHGNRKISKALSEYGEYLSRWNRAKRGIGRGMLKIIGQNSEVKEWFLYTFILTLLKSPNIINKYILIAKSEMVSRVLNQVLKEKGTDVFKKLRKLVEDYYNKKKEELIRIKEEEKLLLAKEIDETTLEGLQKKRVKLEVLLEQTLDDYILEEMQSLHVDLFETCIQILRSSGINIVVRSIKNGKGAYITEINTDDAMVGSIGLGEEEEEVERAFRHKRNVDLEKYNPYEGKDIFNINKIEVHGLKKNSHRVKIKSAFLEMADRLEEQKYIINFDMLELLISEWSDISCLLSEESWSEESETLRILYDKYLSDRNSIFSLCVYIDARGRIYLRPHRLSPISSKLMRSLISFETPYDVSIKVFYRYALELYYGKSVYNSNKRVEEKDVIELLESFNYKNADEPLLFLRCCVEYKNYGGGNNLNTRLVMYTDMRSSGSQFLSILTKNDTYISSLGLTEEYPSTDYYVEKAKNMLREVSPESNMYIKKYLRERKVELRKCFKRPIMVMNYGLSPYGLRDYLKDMLDFYLGQSSDIEKPVNVTIERELKEAAQIFIDIHEQRYSDEKIQELYSKSRYSASEVIKKAEEITQKVRGYSSRGRTACYKRFARVTEEIYNSFAKEYKDLGNIFDAMVNLEHETQIHKMNLNPDHKYNYSLNVLESVSDMSSVILYNEHLWKYKKIAGKKYKRGIKLVQIDIKKTVQSLIAHYIHQLDSYVLRSVLASMKELKEPIIPIHDSFGIRLSAQDDLLMILYKIYDNLNSNSNLLENTLYKTIERNLSYPSPQIKKSEIHGYINKELHTLCKKKRTILAKSLYNALVIVDKWRSLPQIDIRARYCSFPNLSLDNFPNM